MRPGRIELVALRLQTLDRPRLWKLFSGKHENRVSAFVLQGHPVGKGTLSRDPPDVYPEPLRRPHACHIEVLMAHGLHHLPKLLFYALPWLAAYTTHNSWHILFFWYREPALRRNY